MPEPGLHVSQISIKVEGTPISAEAIGDLLEVTVDHHLHLPSMFTIRMLSHDMKWLDDETFREGKKIEITYGEQSAEKLLKGKVAVLEPDLNEAMPVLLVRGYDLSHGLYRGRKRRSFKDVTDSDLVKKLAPEAGLQPGTVDSTSEIHEYVFQNNQTNAEFLVERANNLGFELWVEDDKLNFRKPQPGGEPVSVAWGTNLRSFRPRLSTAEQVNEVEVRGWDPKQKREVVGRASKGNGSPQIGIAQPGADVAKNAWGEAKYAVVDKFVRSPAEADKVAQAMLDKLSSGFVEAEGTCDGNAKLKAGAQIKIDGVGNRFNGTYYVTQAIHHWTKDAGLKSHFTVSGMRDRGIFSMLQDSQARDRTPVMALVIGIVTNNRDPLEQGRVLVKFPTLSADDESAWARIASPMAGDDRGFFYLPEVDDEVLAGFESGDIHRPFILGVLWNGKDKPPIKASDAVGGNGMVNKRVIKSRSGHIITLDDSSGGEEITIVDKTGNNKIVMHSPDNSMQIKVDGDFTLEAKGKITFKSIQGVDMQSQADFKVSGQTGVDISTTAQMKLSGTAAMDISSTGPMTVAGLPIKLN